MASTAPAALKVVPLAPSTGVAASAAAVTAGAPEKPAARTTTRAAPPSAPQPSAWISIADADDEDDTRALADAGRAFVERLQRPEASDVVRLLKRFVSLVHARPDLDADALAASVRALYDEVDGLLGAHPLWSAAGATELDAARDGVEKYVMGRLHDRLLPPAGAARERERALDARRRALSRLLLPSHLGLGAPYAQGAPWPAAQAALAQMGRYRTPRDKLVCVLNFGRTLNRALADAAHAHRRAGGAEECAAAHGADELFPAIVLALAHARMPALHAALQYVSVCRHPLRLHGEAHYFLTACLSALAFIDGCRGQQLAHAPPPDAHRPPPAHAQAHAGGRDGARGAGHGLCEALAEDPAAAFDAALARELAREAAAPDTDAGADADASAAPQLKQPGAAAAGAERAGAGAMAASEGAPEGAACAAPEQRSAQQSGPGARAPERQEEDGRTAPGSVPARAAVARGAAADASAGRTAPAPAPPSRLRFAHVRRAEELRMGEVAALLAEYEALSAAVRAHVRAAESEGRAAGQDGSGRGPAPRSVADERRWR